MSGKKKSGGKKAKTRTEAQTDPHVFPEDPLGLGVESEAESEAGEAKEEAKEEAAGDEQEAGGGAAADDGVLPGRRLDAPWIALQGEFEVDDFPADVKGMAQSLLETIKDINGDELTSVSGQPRTYIEATAYKVRVVAGDGCTLSQTVLGQIERALDFKALGSTESAYYGACLRAALRDFFDKSNECRTKIFENNNIDAETKEALEAYVAAGKRNSKTGVTFTVNAISFAAQAAVNMYSKLHHWDAKNKREWEALFGALGLSEKARDLDFRPIVYLALHPIPMSRLDNFRKGCLGQALDLVAEEPFTVACDRIMRFPSKGYVNSVVIRAGSFPAGMALVSVVKVGSSVLFQEDYAPAVKSYIEDSEAGLLAKFNADVEDVRVNGVHYHVMARYYNVEKKVFDMERYKLIFSMVSGYILAVAKGTLQKSAALKKFVEANARQVNLWKSRFYNEEDSKETTLSEFLEASSKKRLTAVKASKKIANSVKLMEKLVDMEQLKKKLKTLKGDDEEDPLDEFLSLD